MWRFHIFWHGFPVIIQYAYTFFGTFFNDLPLIAVYCFNRAPPILTIQRCRYLCFMSIVYVWYSLSPVVSCLVKVLKSEVSVMKHFIWIVLSSKYSITSLGQPCKQYFTGAKIALIVCKVQCIFPSLAYSFQWLIIPHVHNHKSNKNVLKTVVCFCWRWHCITCVSYTMRPNKADLWWKYSSFTNI